MPLPCGYSLSMLLLGGAVFSVLLILLRLVWVYPGAAVGWLVWTRLLGQNEPRPGVRQTFAVGWTGIRGVACLVRRSLRLCCRMAAALLSLTGIPAMTGFLGKFQVLAAGAAAAAWPLIIIFVALTVLL